MSLLEKVTIIIRHRSKESYDLVKKAGILQFNLFIILLIAAFLISIILAVYTWHQKKRPYQIGTFLPYALYKLYGALASLFEAVFTDLGLKIIFTKISYLGVVTSPVFFLFFIARYTNMDNWITARSKPFLLVIPAATFLMAATNELHELVWPDIYLKQNDIAGIFAFYEHGLWYWVNIVYSYIFLAAGIVMLISSLVRYKRFYSLQSRVLVVASFAPFIGNILYSFHQTGLEGMDITPVCFSLSGLFLTLAIIRYHLFDITPIAREAVIENLHDGILLINRDNKLVDLNQAACRLLSLDNKDIGKPADKVLAGYERILGFMEAGENNKSTVRRGLDK